MNTAPQRVDAIVRALETALLDGTYPAHARMPAERALAGQFGVSRNTVREALQRLATRGLLRIRPGAGVYVTDQLRTSTVSPWRQLVAEHPGVRHDVLEFRHVLEGATAAFAARRADAADRARIGAELAALEAARRANDSAAEAAADTRLHEAIALASHNSMFLHLHNSVILMLREHITQSGNSLRTLHAGSADALLAQHRAICQAILAGDAEGARAAMQEHIDFVAARMGGAPETR
ncbi:MAG: FadR/GntR family transcriptional regulator [Gammaproteobacteria bacterium]